MLVAAGAAGTANAANAANGSAPLSSGYAGHLAELINDYRLRQGLAPLAFTEDLVQLAGEHSASMAGQRQLSHEGFRTRFQRAGSKVCVENVGWNYPTAEALLDGWRLSPAHHRNLLEPKVSRMGIAVQAHYVTFFACR
ncbi:MAG: CAP domain-containing protein [Rubrivivax sp.]|nr:CAP domain-containing protein [Rubrivivax sp.]